MNYLLCDNVIIYKVKKGESLSSLAFRFNTTVESICEGNSLEEDIVCGQTLFIKPIPLQFKSVKTQITPNILCGNKLWTQIKLFFK